MNYAKTGRGATWYFFGIHDDAHSRGWTNGDAWEDCTVNIQVNEQKQESMKS